MKFELELLVPFSFMCFPGLHLFISLFWVSSQIASSQFLGSANEGDFKALLSTKAQIAQDPFGILASWNNSLHFCSWKGVSCNMAQQRVVGLNLAGFELRGTLSASIGNLTFLKDLNIKNNFFSGSIPQEISQLYHLQHLLLSNNSFVGEIPRNLTYLSEINVIDLDRNNLAGGIPAEVGLLSNLLELHISQNRLNGTIPSSLGNLSALMVLSLSGNNLEGIIPQEFGKLSCLQFLQLSSNRLTGALPLLLHNITSMQHIMLASNKLSGVLPWELGLNLPNLQTFSVGENQFMGPIPSSITNASGLVILDIGGNSLSGNVPMNLGSLKQLQRLDLSSNLLGSNENIGLNFLTSLTNCTNLRVLHLNQNNLSGILPGSIANLSTTLMSLRLDGNYISGGIPDSLESLKNLYRLALNHNSFTGIIPDSIGKLTKLQGLYLSNNRFVGRIPSSVGNITVLSILELQQNMFEGGIPASFSNCRSLLALDLSHNKLTGAIDKQIFDIFTLTLDFNLSQNFLTGPLPFEVGKLKNLLSLDISHNNLFGELPSMIGSCVALQVFSIQGNLFSGSIPQSFGQSIQLLDLSSNNLSGKIPADLATFRLIQFLNLSYNMLEGEVPKEGLFINSTLFSIEGNEKLCGGKESLQLSECKKPKLPRKGKVKFSMVLVIPSLCVLVLMLVVYACAYCCWPRSIKVPLDRVSDHYRKLSFAELHKSTGGFSPTNLIATGRYSSVYKGSLSSGERVAIKVINLQESGGRKSFVAECEALRKIRHRNLVKIITTCSGEDFERNEFKALVYEFMCNGDLDSWLHPIPTDFQQPKKLEMTQRLNIAIDIASALVYLHHDCDMPVIHHDIKPSNILLDHELCAHVGDFGSARSLLLPIDETKARTRSSARGIIGTVGYVALECGMGGKVSTRVDVYSYGILLLEMFTGKRPTDGMFKHDLSLRNYVKMAIPDHVMRIADAPLLGELENRPSSTAEETGRTKRREIEQCLASIFRIGVTCSANSAWERMEIKDALTQLQAIRYSFFQSG